MNKKALSLAITLAMAFPAASHALGLGDIQSNSHLNQPFRGKIPVLSATPAEARNIRVHIASPEVFNRVGLDRPAFLNSLRFNSSVENGKPVILVSSTQAIHEPFVNFLLEVNWPKGQLLKEYTALLDPPVLMQPGTAVSSNTVGVRAEPGKQGRINRPVAQQPRRQQQRRIVRAPAPSVRSAPARRTPAIRQAAPNRRIAATAPRTRTYRVKGGDTLYKVAKKLGYRGIRTEQMMMALFEANPKAFHKQNVNILKKGALMRQPAAQQARGISYRSAKSQLASHTAPWKKYRAQLAGNSTSQNKMARSGQPGGQSATSLARDNAKKTAKGATTKAPDHKLIVSGNDGSVVNDINLAGNATATELKKQLVLASESLTARSNENAELKSRVAELESLLRKKNRLITLKSEQLAELQARMGGGAEVTLPDDPETTVVGTEPEEPITTSVPEEGTDIQQQVANQDANGQGEIIRAGEPEVEEPAVQAPTVAATPAVPEDKGILGLLGDPLVTGIGGGSLLALLGGLWFMRRRKGGTEGDEEYVDFDLDHDVSQAAGLEPELGQELAEGDFSAADFGVEDSMFSDQTTQGADSDTNIDVEGESKEENILQEADVYLVYGLHDQAEAELRKALEDDPDNLAYRAKLIENFKAAGDKKGFEKEVKIFKGMQGPNKEKLWQDISEWGKSLIPDSSLFSAKSATAAAAGAVAAGVAVTAGQASPEDIEDAAQFSGDIDKALEDNGLEDIDTVLDDDFSVDVMAEDNTLGDDIDDVMSGSLDSNDKGSTTFTESLDEGLDIVDFDLDGFNKEDKLEFTTDSIEETVDGLDLDASVDSGDNKLDMTHLNLDIDANDFDKIMPEDHAYKKVAGDDTLGEMETVKESLTVDDAIVEDNRIENLVDDDSEDNLLADFDDNLSFLDLEDSGEVIEETQIGTKLDLAKAYIDMGDIEGARSTLEEVMMEGNDEQKKEAEELLHQTG